MSELERAKTKGDPIVQYCSICGVEFDERQLSNRWFKCDSCDTIQQVKSRTEFKLNPDED
tara:strand:+ start:643 stop:822 length:180 start_codon:yes stop_codon:yes gene_type:complete